MARWVRYTLNRLAQVEGFCVRTTTGGGLQQQPGNQNIRIQLCGIQERLVEAELGGAGPRQKYCLRRFVATFPLWTALALHAVTPSDVDWWFLQRKPYAVPQHEDKNHRNWFDAELRAMFCMRWSQQRASETILPVLRRTVPLVSVAPPMDLPLNVLLFFRSVMSR